MNKVSNYIVLVWLAFGYEVASAQNRTIATEKINNNLPDNSSQQITASKVRETLTGIVDYTSTMTPSMSVAQLRAGNAGDANSVIIDDVGKRALFVYNPNSQANDDGVTVVVANGKRFERQEGHITPEMFGAVGNGTNNDTQAIADAVAVRKELYLAKDYKVTSFFNKYGVLITGPGRILRDAPDGGTYQVNTYADNNQHIFGREYLYHMYNRMLTRGSGSITGDLIGDSTTEGVGVSAPYQLDDLMQTFLAKDGIPNVTINNRGVSSSHIGMWLNGTELATGPKSLGSQVNNYGDFVVIRWGVSDASYGRTVENFLNDLDAALTTIRAAKPVTSTSIVLMSPNSVSDSGNNRDEKWFEQISGGIRTLARKHLCAYIDLYAMFQDSRFAAGNLMDAPYAPVKPHVAIHPKNEYNVIIAEQIYNVLFPPAYVKLVGAVSAGGGSGNLSNQSSTTRIVTSSDLPNTFTSDITLSRATTGMPFNGASFTMKQADNVWFQISTPYLVADSWKIPRIRYGAGFGGPAWGGWIGMGVATPTRAQKTVSMSDPDSGYEIGEGIYEVNTAEGWPASGILKVEKSIGGITTQKLTKNDPSFVEWSRTTYFNGSVTVWTPWSIGGNLKGGISFDPPSIAGGAYATTTISVPGAILGKIANVAFSINTGDDIELMARVSATGVVTVKFKNVSASPIDLNQGMVYVNVEQ